MNEDYRARLRIYAEQLLRTAESGEWNPNAILPVPLIIGPLQCALATEQNSQQFLTTPGQRLEGLKELRDFTMDIENLIIVDKYFFSGASEHAESLRDEFKRSARVGGKTLQNVHIIYSDKAEDTTKSIRKMIVELARHNKVKLTGSKTVKIHDRIWIGDGKKALAVGTSFGGIGQRAAFLLPLPNSDLEFVLEFLENENLMPRHGSII